VRRLEGGVTKKSKLEGWRRKVAATKTRATWLGPGIAVFREGQGANAVAGGGEDGVGDGGERWRKRGLAQTGRGIVSLQVVDFDRCRRLIYTHRFVFVEITLFCAAAIDGDFASHEIAESFGGPRPASDFRR